MEEAGANPDLVAFVQRHIRTVEQLEILLLLSKDTSRSWTPSAVYEVTKSNLQSVRQRLKELCQDGILTPDEGREPSYRFDSRNHGLAQLVQELAALYQERPVRVLHLIYSGIHRNQNPSSASM